MPGLPLAVRENPNSGHYQNHSRTVDLSAEEAIAAEESFEVYCKPVELYNILQRRSIKNPLFPQRCLSYKTEAKCKRRIHMTISFSGILNAGVEVQKILPLHILLARPNPYIATGGQHHTVYSIKQACIIAASSEFESRGRSKATFILPEIKKLLAEALSSKLTILFVSAEKKNLSYERNPFDNSNNTSYPSAVGGYCLCGEIPIEFLNWTPETCVNLSSVNGAELLSTVDMKSCFLERCSLNVGSNISFKFMDKPGTMHVQVKFFAQEIGAKDGSPYHSYVHENVPTSLLPQIARLRSGNVLFNYKYYNGRLEKIEPSNTSRLPTQMAKLPLSEVMEAGGAESIPQSKGKELPKSIYVVERKGKNNGHSPIVVESTGSPIIAVVAVHEGVSNAPKGKILAGDDDHGCTKGRKTPMKDDVLMTRGGQPAKAG